MDDDEEIDSDSDSDLSNNIDDVKKGTKKQENPLDTKSKHIGNDWNHRKAEETERRCIYRLETKKT